ncbi:hypothetical protein OOU_Y34scaffold00218g4 [Pyricularia oryzae Y34]|uniref:Uncharacterized protein n=2 Tax=Pyricularia oryzae TaxID=318829 RepID=A0AA97PPG6_PYRO3|nr:hypothetical protein OOU_Y34scaffold00218g4 [Pyricularia oryzae Y34]
MAKLCLGSPMNSLALATCYRDDRLGCCITSPWIQGLTMILCSLPPSWIQGMVPNKLHA